MIIIIIAMHCPVVVLTCSVRRRMDFKMATLVYLSLFGMALANLTADCQLASDEGRRQLRFATSRTCVVRGTYGNYGDCSCRSEAVQQPS